MVDAAYSVFDLADRDDYGRFLLAHACATGAAEQQLYGNPALPAWRPRMPLLTEDLDKMCLAGARPIAFGPGQGDAWRWGVLYVLEGSRLGAGILVKRTPAGAPTAYLSSRHLAGEWRTLLCALDARGSMCGPAWIDAAIIGARACFELYRQAALLADDAPNPGQSIAQKSGSSDQKRRWHTSRSIGPGV